MPKAFIKTKPSLMEAGLPCSSLSAECQADNDARQRPPQNRLHIWWARRPPTVCRVAILTALTPHDAELATQATAQTDPTITEADLESLTNKERQRLDFYLALLADYPPTQLTDKHQQLLLMLRAFGDPARFAEQRAVAREAKVPLPKAFSKYLSSNRDTRIPESLIVHLRSIWKSTLGLAEGDAPVMLDFMAGGGAIPLEGIRYGLKVYANDLNPVASLVQKATLEYPAKFGRRLAPVIDRISQKISENVRLRLEKFFPFPPASEWWPDVEAAARAKFSAKAIQSIEPGDSAKQIKNSYLWCRVFPCKGCGLGVPLSTNFTLDSKGKPETHLAAFPVVPARGVANTCQFRIVRRAEWSGCHWPKPDFTEWHPQDTPTYSDGSVICPRCGKLEPSENVKEYARSLVGGGGLPSQLYAIACQVPVSLSYRDGSTRVRYMCTANARGWGNCVDLRAVPRRPTTWAGVLTRAHAWTRSPSDARCDPWQPSGSPLNRSAPISSPSPTPGIPRTASTCSSTSS